MQRYSGGFDLRGCARTDHRVDHGDRNQCAARAALPRRGNRGSLPTAPCRWEIGYPNRSGAALRVLCG